MMRVRLIAVGVVLALAPGCTKVQINMAGLGCSDGACSSGYVCHPETDICVPEIAIGCAGDGQICPGDVEAGQSCDEPGSFVPCNGGDLDCSSGCRTCVDGAWSECSPGQCQTGTVENCAFCGNDCLALANVAAAVCDTTGVEPVCDITQCAIGWIDTDGEVDTGCEEACTPSGLEICDNIDNDCNGTIDDLSQVATDSSCFGLYGAVDVTHWVCTDGACVVSECDSNQHDVNGIASDGCEYGCTITGAETCDGSDEDCTGAADDMTQGEIDTDCAGQNALAEHVAAWGCSSGSCIIDQCETGWTNAAGGVADGCEETCVPTDPPTEVCDGVDNDCDGSVDLNATDCTVYYRDDDDDTYGQSGDSRCACSATDPYDATVGDDCDDTPGSGANVYPTATELVGDGVDQDCDGFDDCYQDLDDDGFGTTTVVTDTDLDCDNTSALTSGVDTDCDDDVATGCGAACYPGNAEICDGLDNDCANGADDAPATEACAEQRGVCAGSVKVTCNGTSGWDPCDATDYDAWATATFGVGYEDTAGGDETLCNDGFDNDCDGTVDENCPAVAFTTFDRDGANLENDSVTSLAVDSSGNLWVGTDDNDRVSYLASGATSFVDKDLGGDGHYPIQNVFVDHNDDAWFSFQQTNCDNGGGCDCGVFRVLGSDHSDRTFYCTEALSTALNYILSVAEDEDRNILYLGSGDDFTIYSYGTDSVICDVDPASDGVRVVQAQDMVVDNQGPPHHLWIADPSTDVLWDCFHPSISLDQCDHTCTEHDLFNGEDNIQVLALYDRNTADAADDTLWLGSSSAGVVEFDIDSTSVVQAQDDTGALPANQVNAIAADSSNGWVWFGTTSGLARCEYTGPATCDWLVWDSSDGLPSDTITALALDAAHRILWIGTDAGVSRARF